MDTCLREELLTPWGGDYDTIVCGGGPAGVCAAIASARQGAKTLLLEKMNCLGGMWTSGLVNPLFDQEGKGGLIREIVERLDAEGAWGGFRHICFGYENMKHLLDTMTCEAGVDVRFNTLVSRVIKDGNRVTGVVTESIDGRRAYRAHTVIDCTGDAAVCADAGAEIAVGDETGDCQPMTLMFILANIPDKYNNEVGIMCNDILEAAYAKEGKGRHPVFNQPVIIPIPNTRYATVQLTHMYHMSALSSREVTEAIMEGRRQVMESFEVLKKYDPDFAETDLIVSAPMLGVRESRRVMGDYVLTLDDLVAGRTFEDGIASSAFNIDIHHTGDEGQTCVIVPLYQIPYRCLLVKGIEGLLVAGRCISGTHEAMASYRVTGDCADMGESAGIAAALAAKQGCTVREVSAGEIIRIRQK